MKETLKEKGLDIGNPDTIRDFMFAVAATERRMATKATDESIAEDLGISTSQLKRLKYTPIQCADGVPRTYYEIATEALLSEYLEEASRSDARMELMSIMHGYTPKILDNIARIAAGEPSPDSSMVPRVEDQIRAAHVLFINPLMKSYLSLTFTGKEIDTASAEHLAKQRLLSSNTSVLRLDDVIDGTVISQPQPSDVQPQEMPL